MISREDNERLTQVKAGTSVGDLLRRYWYPIAAVSELARHPTKFIKILGEELVLFKDCLLYTSPSPRDRQKSRMPSSA